MQTDSTHFRQISTDRTDKQPAASQRDNHLLTTNQKQKFCQIKSQFYKNIYKVSDGCLFRTVKAIQSHVLHRLYTKNLYVDTKLAERIKTKTEKRVRLLPLQAQVRSKQKEHLTPTNLSSYYELHPQTVWAGWRAPEFCTAVHLQRG